MLIHICIIVAAFVPQQLSSVVATETVLLKTPEIFTLYPFTEKVGNP